MGCRLQYYMILEVWHSSLDKWTVSDVAALFLFQPQIQFKEKVLWTAITLFIFLVCCQVRWVSSDAVWGPVMSGVSYLTCPMVSTCTH